MKQMFMIADYGRVISPVNVEKETAHFVTYSYEDWKGNPCERRTAKEGHFFPTWEAAHDHLVSECEKSIKRAEGVLHRYKAQLGNLKAMKPTVSA